ncbi:putative transcription factor C3H family [Helianthus annuus]|nr:putative transcription factor C3H family [Helianthus annuus]KAJ0779590.1 putative transcription factor C3H family [Helianthus annuus]KAJ0914610.1 putative transcription factor C3H family [Helianthus annuus]
MVGDENHHNMMVHVPPWTTLIDDPLTGISPFSPRSPNATVNSLASFEDYAYFLRNDAALRRYLEDDLDGDADNSGCTDFDITSEPFACDSFRMYDFKVRKCARARSHDWTDCPYAHPGEKARRRDPRKYSYSGTACPEFRKGSCKKGDGCEFSHGVFECWLHPHRYRTQPCKDGINCRRRVCFFAHTPEQLRVVSPHGESSHGFGSWFSSPSETSTPPSESPPMSPMDGSLSRSLGSVTVGDMLTSLRRLQLNKTPSMGSPWSMQMGRVVSSPRSGFYSLPSTPTRPVTRPSLGFSEIWEEGRVEEEPVMERVESGRDLRVKMFEKLKKENSLDRVDPNPGESSNPDVEWISELVK